MPIRDFSSPAFANGHIYFAIARKDDANRNQYMLVLARGYGMAVTRKGATLNSSTSSAAAEAPTLSSSGHPLIWFDADWERDPSVPLFPEGGLLNALLAAEPPVIRTTGRSRTQRTKQGEEHEAPEVEILLGEDELAHICCYCGDVELSEGDRWQRCNNNTSTPAYCCTKCSGQSTLRRNLTSTLRRLHE